MYIFKGLRPLPPAPFCRLLPPSTLLLAPCSSLLAPSSFLLHCYWGWARVPLVCLQFGLGFDLFMGFSLIWRWFLVSWRSLGRLLGTLVDVCSPLGVQGNPLEVPGRFVHQFRVSFGGLWASNIDKKGGLEHAFSTHAFGMVYGSVLCWFMDLHGGPGIWTNM